PPLTNWVDPCGIRVRLLAGRWPDRWRPYIFALGVAWTLFKERRHYEIAYFLMQGAQLATGLPVARMLGKRIVMKFSCSSQVVRIGSGTLRAEIGRLVQDLGLEENVVFTGRLDTNGVLKWLQAGDVFTLISAIEGLPCSVLEAMSAGMVPVVSDIPAHTQIID